MRKSSFSAIGITLCLHMLILYMVFSQKAGSWHHSNTPYSPRTLTVALVSPQPPSPATAPILFQLDETFFTLPNFIHEPRSPEPGETGSSGLKSDYYPAKELSEMPEALTDLATLQPAMADNGIYGKLTIRLWLNEFGHIDRLTSIDADLPKEIEQSVLTAFGKMQFKPGKINNKPVKTWVEIVVEYGDKPIQVDLPQATTNSTTAIPPSE